MTDSTIDSSKRKRSSSTASLTSTDPRTIGSLPAADSQSTPPPATAMLSPNHSNKTIDDEGDSTNTSDSNSNSNNNSGNPNTTTIRQTMGHHINQVTHLINDHLIPMRMGALAGVTLLTVYGIAQTPLLFRYKHLFEIPSSSFRQRRTLYGRIMGVVVPSAPQQHHATTATTGHRPVQVTIRHLSPIGQVLPKTWFDFLFHYHPSNSSRQRQRSMLQQESATHDEKQDSATTTTDELLKVQLAGIHAPIDNIMPSSRLSYTPETYLQQLAKQRAWVSCQLVARKVSIASSAASSNRYATSTTLASIDSNKNHNSNSNKKALSKRPLSDLLPELEDATSTSTMRSNSGTEDSEEMIAVVKLHHRPRWLQFFATDVAESLVQMGKANVSSSLLSHHEIDDDGMVVGNDSSSQHIHHLRADGSYLDRLTQMEYKAAHQSKGMWSDPVIRDRKQDVVDEGNFQKNATVFQKVWRWIRGG